MIRRHRICSSIVIASALVLISGAASAGTTNTTLPVSVNVLSSCTASTQPLTFPPFASLPNTDLGSTALTVNCSNGTTWTAAADVGGGTGATFGVRKLSGPAGALLNYVLGTTLANIPLAPWGD